MNLHNPAFERNVRRRVKAAVRSSPALRRERRTANRKFQRHYSGFIFVRVALWGFIMLFAWLIQRHSGNTIAALGVLSLWTFVFVFLHANALFLRLFGSTDMPVLSMLPVTENLIFRWQLQKFLRRSLFSLVDIVAALGTLAYILEFSWIKWIPVLLISFFTWLVSLALAAFCAARVQRRRYVWVPRAIFPLVIGWIFVNKALPEGYTFNFIDGVAPSFNLLLPTGWAVSLFQLLLPHPVWLISLVLFPLIAIITTLPGSLARLRSFYVYREYTRPETHDLPLPPVAAVPQSKPDNSESLADLEEARRRGPTEIVQLIQSRVMFSPPPLPKSARLESILWRWLTPRERLLFEFAFPQGLAIWKYWRLVGAWLSIACAIGFSAGAFYPQIKSYIIGFGMLFSATLVIATVNISGTAFRRVPNGGVNIPLLAYFPIGIKELSRLLLKISAIQLPLLAVWGAVCGLLIAHLFEAPLLAGMMSGLRGAGMFFASRFIFTVLSFSSGLNYQGRFGFWNLVLLIWLVPLAFLFFILAIANLVIPVQLAAWLVAAAAFLCAYIFFRVYAWFYNRAFFDLLILPRR